MKSLPVTLVLLLIGLAWGCGSEQAPAEPEAETTSAEPAILERPFTADQIRDGMPEGLVITWRKDSGHGVSMERWTVVASDDDGCEIEYLSLDGSAAALGEPERRSAGWIELRDHANFPADSSTREEISRETPLGTLDGWLYTVRDDAGGTVTEFFFARSLPGAPVSIRVHRGDQLILAQDQFERLEPA